MGRRSRSNLVEEITVQVPSLDPRFAVFIDLCSCDFQAVESFTVKVLITYFLKSTFSLVMSVLYVKKLVICLFVFFVFLTGECFYSGPELTVLYLRSTSIILRQFCPLCYKHVNKVSPRIIKD